jgi:hypothetical protein
VLVVSAQRHMLPCQRFETNAYRILGVSAGSTWLQILNGAAALQRSAMLGIEETAVDRFGEIVRDEAAIRAAIGSLSNPRERIQHRLLWFHGPVCLEIKGGAGPRPELSPSEIEHEKALSQLAAAFLLEDTNPMIAALRRWRVFLDTTQYWDYLAQSETQENFEPAANTAELAALREQAMTLAAEPLVCAARSAWSRQQHSTLRSYLAALRQLEETGPWAATCRQELLFPLTQKLADECLTVKQKYLNKMIWRDAGAEGNRIVCVAALQFYRQHVVPAYNDIATVVAEDDQEARLGRGQTADLLHRIALDYTWADAFETTAQLAVEAVALAAGTIEEARIRAALGKYVAAGEEQLRRKVLAEATATLDEAIATFDAHLASAEDATEIVAALRCYRGSVEPLLTRLLAEFALCGERCVEWRAKGAACLARVADSLAASQEFPQAETLTREAIALATGTTALAGLRQLLDRIKESEIQARGRQAEQDAAEQAAEVFWEHCRSLAAWGEMVREQEGFAQENGNLARCELSFFRARIYPALQQVAHLAGWETPGTRMLKDEAARQLTEIAIHHSWAGEASTAQALLQEALGFAAAETIEALRQSYQTRHREARPVAGEREQESSAGWLNRGEHILAALAIGALAIGALACLAAFKSNPSQRAPVPIITPCQPVAPAPQAVGVSQDDGDTAKRRVLLEQIHLQERAAQQMERQLVPLRTEIEELRAAGGSSPTARENLETAERIYQQLLYRRDAKLSQAKRLRQNYRLLAGHTL